MTVLKNDTFKRYLYYLLRKNLLRDIILAFTSITFLVFKLRSISYPRDCGLSVVTWIGIIISAIMPMLTFSVFNQKRNLDCIYPLPLDRKKVALAYFISGEISFLCIYTACFIVFLINVAVKFTEYNIEYILLFYFISAIYFFVVYSFFCFIFTRANTGFDGVVFCLGWTFTISLIIFAFAFLVYVITGKSLITDLFLYIGIIIAPIYSANEIFGNLVFIKTPTNFFSYIATRPEFYFSYPFWMIVGGFSLFGLIKTFPKKAAYKAEDISNSIFGYKFLVPITGFTLMYILKGLGTVVVSAILYIGMVIGYAIYRRGFRFKKSDIIILVIGLLLLLKWVFFGSLSFNQY